MTILGIFLLLIGMALVCDGAFSRGLLITVLPDPGPPGVALIRLSEVLAGGLVFVLVGFALSTC